jgi:hypothetical protein
MDMPTGNKSYPTITIPCYHGDPIYKSFPTTKSITWRIPSLSNGRPVFSGFVPYRFCDPDLLISWSIWVNLCTEKSLAKIRPNHSPARKWDFDRCLGIYDSHRFATWEFLFVWGTPSYRLGFSLTKAIQLYTHDYGIRHVLEDEVFEDCRDLVQSAADGGTAQDGDRDGSCS